MVSAQYLKKCSTYPHQIWYTEATGHIEDSSNRVTLISFSRSQKSSKATAYERWFPLNISRNPHQIWYTEARRQGEDHVRTGWPWLHFQGHRGPLIKATAYERWFLLSTQEIFDVSSPNLVHRSSEYQVWTSWPWPSFRGHEGHLNWFPSISEEYLMESH